MLDLVGAGLKIEVLGVHPLNADEERFRQFFCECAGVDRIDVELIEFDEQLYANAHEAALIEIAVDDEAHTFDPALLVQENPDVATNLWQVAWNETYLTEDGSAVISGYPVAERPNTSKLRVAFFMHDFERLATLSYSGVNIPLPPASPPPERLWRLVPYELP
ncbi:MAG TPA: hypothetical protein PLK42_15030 [Casimicrobium sp.]|nr:hypothetical protein [Casimicrobium sp.]